MLAREHLQKDQDFWNNVPSVRKFKLKQMWTMQHDNDPKQSSKSNKNLAQKKKLSSGMANRIVVSKMLYGTDTHPNMAPARYKQPVARQFGLIYLNITG
uniref:Uncharacterized protein n=1 Tax=Gadus morhua TaxID=8049 RepID=A0A8C4ZYB2_GADMO